MIRNASKPIRPLRIVWIAVNNMKSALTTRRLRLSVLIVVLAALFITDAWSKAFALGRGEQDWTLIPGVLRWELTHNTGIAFGLPLVSWFFWALIPVLIGGLGYAAYKKYRQGRFFELVALGGIIVGALGNIVDRLRYGAVIDFLHITYWHVFNLADVYITVGVVGLIISMLYEKKIPKT